MMVMAELLLRFNGDGYDDIYPQYSDGVDAQIIIYIVRESLRIICL